MRKSLTLKMMFRSPVKTLLTFLLVGAASFALLSRVTDYAMTRQETRKIEGFYHCTASLDNTMPDYYYTTAEVESKNKLSSKGYTGMQEAPDKPWLTAEQMEQFASLPGVTLSGIEYRTAGLVEDYPRMPEDQIQLGYLPVVFEGTYAGYVDDTQDESILEDHISLKFDDVRILACEKELDIAGSIQMMESPLGDTYYAKSPYTRAFFDNIPKGSRCLVLGNYNGFYSDMPIGFYVEDPEGTLQQNEGYLRVIDGLPEDYLETEEFARQKGWIDAIEQGKYVYDFVYTSDMRALGFSERTVKGHMLTEGDTDVCVVGEAFLEAHNLSIGDTISVRLGDRLYTGMIQMYEGTDIPGFSDPVTLTIAGTYGGEDGNRVYVPDTLLQAEIPDDYEIPWDYYSVYVDDARDIEGFLEAAETFAEELNLKLEYSDHGWMDIKDSFEKGAQMTVVTMAFYIAGAALALFLAVYLYVGRSRKTYAIMRTLGVSGRAAGWSVVLPFAVLSAFAVPLGGILGISFAGTAAKETLAGMMDSAPKGYVLHMTLPAGVIALSIGAELLVLLLSVSVFLRKMKQTPPLELLQESTAHRGTGTELAADSGEVSTAPVRFDAAKISVRSVPAPKRNYGAVRHVSAYILRHMRRGIGKTAVSLILAVVMTGGIGMFVLAGQAYQDAFYQYGVTAQAHQYAFTSVVSLSKSKLVRDFYCHSTFDVHIRGLEGSRFITSSNDLVRFLGDGCTITYADGYDMSSFEGTGTICLIGKTLAEELGISPGDEIGMLSGSTYYMLQNEERSGKAGAIENGYQRYQVIGIADSGEEMADQGIFTGIRVDMTNLYGMDFPVDYCTFTLADNDRVDDLEALLEEERAKRIAYAPYASYRIDSEGLETITRIQELLEMLFPTAVAAAVLIGVFVPLLVILQSAQEAAALRVLGVTKKRVWCILAVEQIALCLAGILLAAAGTALLRPGLFAGSWRMLAACFGLYLLGGICGAALAALQVTGHRVLGLLQAKE